MQQRSVASDYLHALGSCLDNRSEVLVSDRLRGFALGNINKYINSARDPPLRIAQDRGIRREPKACAVRPLGNAFHTANYGLAP